MQIIFGIVAFVVLFAAWVILPTIVRKRHAMKTNDKGTE
jgi:hypothetical protein